MRSVSLSPTYNFKIDKVEDLDSIRSLGFREALPVSPPSVIQELFTKQAEDMTGTLMSLKAEENCLKKWALRTEQQ